jgi:hypothetical protein
MTSGIFGADSGVICGGYSGEKPALFPVQSMTRPRTATFFRFLVSGKIRRKKTPRTKHDNAKIAPTSYSGKHSYSEIQSQYDATPKQGIVSQKGAP